MKAKEPVVVDTNALISRLLVPGSTVGRAVRKAVVEAQLLASDETIMELADVLGRRKFDTYTTVRERQEFLRLFDGIAERVPIVRVIRACRDPKEDKFLDLAVNGAAQLIITGAPTCLPFILSVGPIFSLRRATSPVDQPIPLKDALSQIKRQAAADRTTKSET